MQLNKINKIGLKKSKRLGRGMGSGKGKTAGRGHKGQKSRSGYNLPRRFEGGQTPLVQRTPKAKGFKSLGQKPQLIKYTQIVKHFKKNELVNRKSLIKKGLIKNSKQKVKIIGLPDKETHFKFNDVILSQKILKSIIK